MPDGFQYGLEGGIVSFVVFHLFTKHTSASFAGLQKAAVDGLTHGVV
jgi:hypothetical protein